MPAAPRTRAKGVMLRVPNQYCGSGSVRGTTCGRLNISHELHFDENNLMGLLIPEWFDST